MGCGPSLDATPTKGTDRHRRNHRRAMAAHGDHRRRTRSDTRDATEEESLEMAEEYMNDDRSAEIIHKGVPFEAIIKKFPQLPTLKPMNAIKEENTIFTFKPLKYDRYKPDAEPMPIDDVESYKDLWDEYHVRMPCSNNYISNDRKPIWSKICEHLLFLKAKCDSRKVNFKHLKTAIEDCNERSFDLECLQQLIDSIYSNEEYQNFMYVTLSKMCDLLLNIKSVCTQPLPLLRTEENRSVTMSQQQAAALLACAFFCLFPTRSDRTLRKEYEDYQNPNFETLYQRGPPSKIEKLKCILHYFNRVTDHMPTGVITFQRVVLPKSDYPQWPELKTDLCDLHLTTGQKIEDIPSVLQIDFANKYIGGGVLGSGCVQEEIRFSICPEMLVSLLICEKMERNECIFLIGCERYSSYKGYAHSFKFAGNYTDKTPRDSWGRLWCHVVAMDAIYFQNPSTQYHMKSIERELLKAYTSFRPLGQDAGSRFGIATGNWGCGAFNGDRQLKAIIQLMAASEARRPLVYAAFGDRKLVTSFSALYEHLKMERATVGDLYYYLMRYCRDQPEQSLFDYILMSPASGF
ncbi:unnamed protein product [Rotaria magnacalcarata]|uniref:poly(ADP-ribose) glycohydrolase n=2 Tax=Rotaria magnacalcarata TaxID=392030 RepID=A0A816SJ31_9BILA|nr:unnamed protein product [Rotaria magnacalcarata]